MLREAKSELHGRLRSLKSRWSPCDLQVEQLESHDSNPSPFAMWLSKASRVGIPYQWRWSVIETRRQQLLTQHATEVPAELADRFIGSHAEFEYIHVNGNGGRFLSALASRFADPTLLEYGTALGVSGMYLLSAVGNGFLWTFDPCDDWCDASMANLLAISDRFKRVPEAFEVGFPKLQSTIGEIDIAFVDGIHTYDHVTSEVELLRPRMKPGGLLVLHDIDLSDEMRSAWNEFRRAPWIVTSAFVEKQFGVLELRP